MVLERERERERVRESWLVAMRGVCWFFIMEAISLDETHSAPCCFRERFVYYHHKIPNQWHPKFTLARPPNRTAGTSRWISTVKTWLVVFDFVFVRSSPLQLIRFFTYKSAHHKSNEGVAFVWREKYAPIPAAHIYFIFCHCSTPRTYSKRTQT